MEISQEILELFSTKLESINSVEVRYPNGGIASGPVKKVKLDPLRVRIIKLDKAGQKIGKHQVMFDHAVKLILEMKDCNKKEFS